MAPRRPLTDLCIISLFKQLTPNEQMKASRMSPRSLQLVRAANRRMKSLIIRTQNTYDKTERIFSTFYYSRHCMQVIKGSVPYFCYLVCSRFSKWNCLLLWSAVEDESASPSTIVDQIVYIFSAVIDLKFAAQGRSEDIEILTKLLQHPQWAGQLTDLMLTRENNFKPGLKTYDLNLACQVTATLNGLSALQLLYVEGFAYLDFPQLIILAQLKVIAVCYRHRYSTSDNSFLRSYKRISSIGTQKKLQQQVHLMWFDNILDEDFSSSNNEEPIPDLLNLSELELSRIVDIDHLLYVPENHTTVLRLCGKLTSLLSLAIYIHIWPDTHLQTTIVPLFTALSKLKKLLYLDLEFCVNDASKSPPLILPPQPLSVQLSSVRALHLQLNISSHAEVKWLNLAQTLPNCQVIEAGFKCFACNVNLNYFTEDLAEYLDDKSPGVTRSVALNCLRSTLPELHLGVHPSKIIIKYTGFPAKHEISLEKLMLLLKSSDQK